MYLFILSQKHLPLALAEAQALYGTKNISGSNEYAIVNITKKTVKKRYQKLAFTKAAYEILFSCSKKEVENKIKKYFWNKIITGTFCVRSSTDEQKFATMIWNILKKKKSTNPKVDLRNPNVLIHFFFVGKKVFVTKKLWQNQNTFLERKAQHRPGFYPASLHPQLALGMVNLSGVISGTIVDPFCGTGGILIEASFSKRKSFGFDISNWMLEKCQQNLAYYKMKKVQIQRADATLFRKKCAAIVTELPFGKNTKSQDLILLYTRFLENAKQNTSTVVVSFPNFIDYKKMCKATKWKIISDFKWYLHASLSKHIVVLKREEEKK